MIEALALSPKPRPSQTPVATAEMFFNAPQISAPATSLSWYILKYGVASASATALHVFLSLLATTLAVGILLLTSSAWFGPDKTAIFEVDNSSSITCDI